MSALSEHNEYDLIIIGAGAFGGLLMMYLQEFTYTGRVLILEKCGELPQKRWSFWSTGPMPSFIERMIEKKWAHWSVTKNEDKVKHAHPNYNYCTINSAVFFEQLSGLSVNAKNIEFKLNEGVQTYEVNSNVITVNTNQAIYKTRKVVDTRNPDVISNCIYKPQGLYQCFIGYEIDCEHDAFDDTNACIMHDLTSTDTGVEFIYVLPFSKRMALIEFTSFNKSPVADEDLKTALDDYLQTTFTHTKYKLIGKEQGILPMFNIKKHSKDKKILNGGISGGSMRASTGYSFLNSMRMAEKQARALIQTDCFIDMDPIAKHYRFMDEVMLKVLINSPHRADSLFYDFSRKVSSATYARFMTEQASIFDLLKVIIAMPKRPFVKACWQIFYENIARK